ncbi:MAG TPA: YtxH domain-containing protein [Nitrospiraceae bacterium]|nr:YtxH domain-containing protein [Nitrospiraceae bacterium]
MSTTAREVAKVAGFIAGGAVVGAAIGLLFAPKAGSETRRDVARYAKRAQVQATRFSRAVQSGVHDVVERGRAFAHRKDEKSIPEAA